MICNVGQFVVVVVSFVSVDHVCFLGRNFCLDPLPHFYFVACIWGGGVIFKILLQPNTMEHELWILLVGYSFRPPSQNLHLC